MSETEVAFLKGRLLSI